MNRVAIAALAHAVRPYVDGDQGPTRAALELANNAAQVLVDEGSGDAELVLAEMIIHRVFNRWMRCGDIESTARVGAAAWRRTVAKAAA